MKHTSETQDDEFSTAWEQGVDNERDVRSSGRESAAEQTTFIDLLKIALLKNEFVIIKSLSEHKAFCHG